MSVEQRPKPGRAARRRRRDRLIATLGTLACHAFMLFVVLASWGRPPIAPPEPPPMEVTLVTPPPPAPVIVAPAAEPAPAASPAKAVGPKTPTPPQPAKVQPPPTPKRIVKVVQPSEVPPRIVPPEPAPPLTEPSVTSAQLASAITADSEAAGEPGLGAGDGVGSGSGGGGGSGAGGRCDMVRRLQRALRDDASVRSAIARAHRAPGFEGRPLVVWNGDWVQHGDEEGKGLASLRQAIAVEVGFAPKACRSQAMRGLVMLSLNDSRGTRVILGAGAWRWSDLLFAR